MHLEKNILNIHYFRVIFCLIIAVHHFTSIFGANNHLMLQFIKDYGQNVVSFFFVISGFCLMYRWRPETFTSKYPLKIYQSLLRKRLLKIWPLHFFTLLLCILSYFLIGTPLAGYIGNIKGTLLSVFLLHDWIPGHPNYRQAWNGVSWFLSALLFCYIFYPLVFNYIKLFARNVKPIYYVVAFLLMIVGLEKVVDFIYFSPVMRFLEFVLGASLAYNLKSKCNYGFNFCDVLLIVLIVLFSDIQKAEYGFFLSPIFASSLYFLSKFELEYTKMLSCSRGTLRISSISMYIYMLHAIVLGFVSYCVSYLNLQFAYWEIFLLFFILTIFSSFAVKYIIDEFLSKIFKPNSA